MATLLSKGLRFGLLSLAAATDLKLTWKDCGDDQTHVKVSNVSPASLTLGQKTTITGSGSLDDDVSGGTYTLTVSALGATLLTHKGDFCKPDSIPLPLGTGTIDWKGESCPVSKGPNSLSMDVTLSATLPPALEKTTIGIQATTTTGDKLLCVTIQTSQEDPLTFEEIASRVNAANVGWVADPVASGRFSGLADVKTLLGTFQRGDAHWQNVSLRTYNVPAEFGVPTSFDPRTQWPKCTVIGKVRNQAGCGSCWAFGATESFEGSRCISTGEDTEFSADDTAACSSFFGNGCNGGQPTAANRWFVSKGVVTGGEYGTKDGCLPYVCPPCKKGLYPPDCPTDQCSSLLKCAKKCSNSDYAKDYAGDKTKAQSAFSVQSVSKMMQALSTTGPLAVAFTVYADFPTYASGVYVHHTGGELGGHAVAMLGWGTESGKAYWLIKNSWSEKWGDAGFFKIAKGVDECGIEDDVSGTLHAATAVVV